MPSLPKIDLVLTEQEEREQTVECSTVPDVFGKWWVSSGLRMPRTFYIEESQTPGEHIDSEKSLELDEGYWRAEDVIKAVTTLLLENRDLKIKYDASQKAAGLAGNASVEKGRELAKLKKEFDEMVKSLHGQLDEVSEARDATRARATKLEEENARLREQIEGYEEAENRELMGVEE